MHDNLGLKHGFWIMHTLVLVCLLLAEIKEFRLVTRLFLEPSKYSHNILQESLLCIIDFEV